MHFGQTFLLTLRKNATQRPPYFASGDPVVPCASCGTKDNEIEGYCSSSGGFVCDNCVDMHSKPKNFQLS